MNESSAITDESAALRRSLENLARRVAVLEQQSNPHRAGASYTLSVQEEAEIRAITQELFPGEVNIDEVFDPEYPGDSYPVVRATASGEIEEIEDRRILWHKRIDQIVDDDRIWRLSLTYLS